jgi:hypothetical protein
MTTATTAADIPPGFWCDAEGRLIPENLVKPIDKAREQLILDLIGKAKELSAVLATFKEQAFDDVDAFVSLSAEAYNAKLGGKKGNLSLETYDGRYKVVRQIQDRLVFDEPLQAAKALIDECLKTWTADSPDIVKALIDHAFQVNKKGKISTERVLGLKKLDISDERWLRAMQAISDSVRTSGSTPYIRFYERMEETGQWRPISLDIAAV